MILTLYRRGFTDKLICDVLNHSLKNGKAIPGVKGVLFDVAYVKQRRKRTGVRRPPAR